jgi:hypothetical protein
MGKGVCMGLTDDEMGVLALAKEKDSEMVIDHHDVVHKFDGNRAKEILISLYTKKILTRGRVEYQDGYNLIVNSVVNLEVISKEEILKLQ